MTGADPTTEPIVWAGTGNGDGEFAYRAWHSGSHLHLRVNDFPAEPLYTLLVDYRPVLDLEDWPAPWLRPAPTAEHLRIAGTEQLRRGRVDAGNPETDGSEPARFHIRPAGAPYSCEVVIRPPAELVLHRQPVASRVTRFVPPRGSARG